MVPGSSSTKLVCIASGFNPLLKWMLHGLQHNMKPKLLMEDNGRLTVISEADISPTEWYKGTTFHCEVADGGNKKNVNISICSGNADSV